jgi:hypothetical protein
MLLALLNQRRTLQLQQRCLQPVLTACATLVAGNSNHVLTARARNPWQWLLRADIRHLISHWQCMVQADGVDDPSTHELTAQHFDPNTAYTQRSVCCDVLSL